MSFPDFSARAKFSLLSEFVRSRISWFWFLAVFLTYLSFSPLAITGMGYMGENVEAAQQIASKILHLFDGQTLSHINWPRHGAVEMIVEVPLLLVQNLLLGESSYLADRIISLQPVLLTSLMSVIVLQWSRRLTGSLKLAIAIAFSASFATMLWPYAYIGLETTQSLFVLLAGFLALDYEKPVTWRRTLALGLVAGIAASAKSNGFFLLPALGFLIAAYFWRDWQDIPAIIGALKKEWAKALVLSAIVLAFYWLGSYSRTIYWSQHGSLLSYVYRNVLIESPLTFLMNLWAQFFSRNKGLIFFAPLAVAGLLASRRAFRNAPQLVYFSWLVLGGSACSLSLLVPWQDEVWGPRYLHTTVAPLVLCLAAALRGISLNRRQKTVLFATAAFGLAVSFLGSMFYYGSLHIAAKATGNATLEHLLDDSRFNHPRFNLKLFHSRVLSADEQWPQPERWWFDKPPDAPPVRSVNLRDYAEPQPLIFASTKAPRLANILKLSLLAGVSLLGLVCWVGTRQKE